jgi:PleD family two-component response regulator
MNALAEEAEDASDMQSSARSIASRTGGIEGTVRNRRPETAAGSSRGLAGIVIVEDQYKVLSGLREFIDQTSDLVVVAACRCADGAMAAVQQYRPQVVILDVRLPDRDGFLVASTVGTYRRIERRLMLFQREFHSGGINLQNRGGSGRVQNYAAAASRFRQHKSP